MFSLNALLFYVDIFSNTFSSVRVAERAAKSIPYSAVRRPNLVLGLNRNSKSLHYTISKRRRRQFLEESPDSKKEKSRWLQQQ